VYAENSTRAAKPAEPMAYPLVTAFVVFPTASNASVTVRTDFGNSAISAIPPALSVTGPYASSATTIPANANIVVAETAIPNKSHCRYANKIPAEKLQEIKQLVSENKYAEALKIFNTLVRSDYLVLSEHPDFYGWLSYNFDNVTNLDVVYDTPHELAEESVKLLALKRAEETATDERIAFYNDSIHSGERDKYPLLPLSNAVKNSLFEGMLSGGKKKNKMRSKKNSKKSTKKYKRQRRYKSRRLYR
jgi:hypothetical protein